MLDRLRAKNEEAFRELFGAYRDKVFNTAVGLLQNIENAEDVTQEVFIEVYRSVVGFREDCSLSTWIYRITIRKSLEHIRSGRRKKRSGIFMSIFGVEDQMPVNSAPFYHPGVLLENKERSVILFRAIDSLPLNQRTAFVLHKVEGLSHAEIAPILNTSVSSVESLIVRANRRLRVLLAGYYKKNEL